jgi:hypothetical protein
MWSAAATLHQLPLSIAEASSFRLGGCGKGPQLDAAAIESGS